MYALPLIVFINPWLKFLWFVNLLRLQMRETSISRITKSINLVIFIELIFHREYPCDHYTSVITVTLVITGCPRVDVQATALQLLQILDKRFFGTVGLLQSEKKEGELLLHLFVSGKLRRCFNDGWKGETTALGIFIVYAF